MFKKQHIRNSIISNIYFNLKEESETNSSNFHESSTKSQASRDCMSTLWQVGSLSRNIWKTHPAVSNRSTHHTGVPRLACSWLLLGRAAPGTLLCDLLRDAWAQMSHSTPLAPNKSPLSACHDCFSLDGSYEAISRKQESALSPSAYWTSLALFSLWGLIRRQHNLPIDCCPPFQPRVPESPGLDSDFACP